MYALMRYYPKNEDRSIIILQLLSSRPLPKRSPSYGRSQHHVRQPEPLVNSPDYYLYLEDGERQQHNQKQHVVPPPVAAAAAAADHHNVAAAAGQRQAAAAAAPDQLDLEALALEEIAASEAEIRAIEEEYRREQQQQYEEQQQQPQGPPRKKDTGRERVTG